MPKDLPAASVPSPQPVAAFVLGRKDQGVARAVPTLGRVAPSGTHTAGVGCRVLAEFDRKATSGSKLRTQPWGVEFGHVTLVGV